MIDTPGSIITKSCLVATQKFYKNGFEVEKGVVLTQQKIEANRKLYEYYINLFTAYPDLYLDLITPSYDSFSLFFYQRIFIRASMRYRYHFCTATRAFSKTFVSVLALILKCIFLPGTKAFVVAPNKSQAAKNTKEKIIEIYQHFPLIRKEIVGGDISDMPGNFGKDYITLTFKNHSVLDIVGALDSTRGGRRNAGLIDEVRDHDADALNSVVIPLLNVARRMPNGEVNPYEPHQAQLYMTSASMKSTYCYEKLIELFEQEIIDPHSCFVWGTSYQVPMAHGLISKQFINEVRSASTFKSDDFAREYCSIYTGGSNESWFNYDRISKYRKIVNPETHRKNMNGHDFFYLLSVDVGRIGCQTVVSVFKVFRNPEGFRSNLVNMYVLGKHDYDRHMEYQVRDLKRIIKAFDPLEVVIDGNGLGSSMLDFMSRPTFDSEENVMYPAYGSFNDEDMKKTQPRDAIPLVYVIKANAKLNSEIHSNCYSRLYSGKVFLLIKEQEAKNKLMATKVGQKMSVEDRAKRLLPHEMTTRLCDELGNLRLKQTGNQQDIVLEQINSRFGKDKFSSFEYGLWRIKELEDEYTKKKAKRIGKRILTFYTEAK